MNPEIQFVPDKIEKSNIHIRLIRDTTTYPYFDMKISISPEDLRKILNCLLRPMIRYVVYAL